MKLMKRIVVLSALALTLGLAASAAADEVQISGYVDGEFLATQVDPGGGASSEWDTSFGDDSEVALWAKAMPMENVSALAEIFYEQSTNMIDLEQAMISWHLAEGQFVPYFGKTYAPFGIEEHSRYSTTNKLISRPMFMTAWTDNGLGFRGTMEMAEDMNLEYDVMLGNGLMAAPGVTTLSTQRLDGNNNSKAAGGRVGIMPMEGLGIGGSFAWGKYDASAENNYMLIGGDAHYEMEGLDVRGEVRYQTMGDVALPGGAADVNGLFFYGQASYELPVEPLQFVEPTARFTWADPNSDVDADQLMQVAVGGTVSPAQGLLLKGEFQVNMEDDAVKTDNNAFSLQAVFGWQ
jgi:hypothetical protein